jgi:hypothetical protein
VVNLMETLLYGLHIYPQNMQPVCQLLVRTHVGVPVAAGGPGAENMCLWGCKCSPLDHERAWTSLHEDIKVPQLCLAAAPQAL